MTIQVGKSPVKTHNVTYESIRDLWVVAWPVLCVVFIVVVLLAFRGHGSFLDVSKWPAIKKIAQDCAGKPDGRVYVKISTYYSIISFGAASFLFLNCCSFTSRVRRVSNRVSEASGKSNDTLLDISLRMRFFAIVAVGGWLAKLSVIDDPALLTMNMDEWIVLITFAFCGIADAIVLIVVWRQKKHELWSANRELVGSLCYIDIPTMIGVALIARYGPVLLLDSKAPEIMFRAIAGGAMIIHVVTSQVILSFLVAEEKISRFTNKHWRTSNA